jgi:hypothetical protein
MTGRLGNGALEHWSAGVVKPQRLNAPRIRIMTHSLSEMV